VKFRIFVVPMLDGGEESQELNRFLATNRVLLVERHFVGLESTGGMRSNRCGTSVEASAHRVIRGGSWNNDAQNVRAAYRNHNEPANRNNNLGFRCAELTTEPDSSLLNRPAPCPSLRATANGCQRPAC
jgi:Sulfatase-modifying factor enzyme 1